MLLSIIASLIALVSCQDAVSAHPICQFEVRADAKEIQRRFEQVSDTHRLDFSHQASLEPPPNRHDMFGLNGRGVEVLARDPFERGNFVISVYSNQAGMTLASDLCANSALQG